MLIIDLSLILWPHSPRLLEGRILFKRAWKEFNCHHAMRALKIQSLYNYHFNTHKYIKYLLILYESTHKLPLYIYLLFIATLLYC